MKSKLRKPRLIKQSLPVIALTLLLGAAQTHATQTIRELFDGLNAGHDYTALDGLTGDVTTVGLSGSWSNNPAGSTGIVYKDTWSLDWPLGGLNYNGILLSHSAGQNGLLNFNQNGNLTSLIDPDTGNPYGNQSSKSYSTHPLAPSAYVNFQTNGTYYFSVRLVMSYSWAVGDSSAGVGLSTGNGPNDRFIGFGVLRPSCVLDDGVTDVGNADYVTTGTLGQAGISLHPEDTSGPYLPVAYGPPGLWAAAINGANAGLLVGRLTTSPSGASTLSVKTYNANSTLDTDPNSIVWDTTYSFTETSTMTRLLVWMHGQMVEYDAIRVGTTYGDVIGLELIGSPAANPGSTVYAGTTVTLSENASLNTGAVPMSFQWLSNSVSLTDATNSTLVLNSPTTAATANYSVIVSNYYGMLTSAVTHITVNPATAPFFVAAGKPVSISRYVGSPTAQFTAVVDGTPPFTFQWQHAGTNIQSAVVTSASSNVLQLPAITLAHGGTYSVIVTNQFGSTNSGPATLSEIVPAAGSYPAVLTSLSPWGYWRLDDNGAVDPTLYDYWGNHNGVAQDPAQMTFQVAGAPNDGFPSPHQAVLIGLPNPNLLPYRLNLPSLPYWTNTMTLTMWVNGGCELMSRNAYGNGYGLENNAGDLQFDWGSTNGQITWDSGLQLPADTWTFVALVVHPDGATIYMGTNGTLTSASSGSIGIISDSIANGDAGMTQPLAVGRNPIPWADDGSGAPWRSLNGTWSDVAVFYQSLSEQQIQNLYLASVGLRLHAVSDASHNLIITWSSGILQQASSVTGPWTDVGGNPASPYSVPMTGAQSYFRLRNN